MQNKNDILTIRNTLKPLYTIMGKRVIYISLNNIVEFVTLHYKTYQTKDILVRINKL